jgi:Hpt domain
MQAVHDELGHAAPDAPVKARTLGHQFAGTGSSFGFPELSDQGRALEHATPDELAAALEQLMRVVHDALEHAMAPSSESVGP